MDKTIIQFHYVNWPDLGIPDSNVFDKLLEAIEEHHSSTKPFITHCSAGIGRTGTFIATHSVRNKIRLKLNEGMDKENISVNLVKDILTMRMQRMELVQTKEQLSAVKKAIFRYQQAL
ncbi:MAG: dual specificity protein phosphatase family protein [Parachlamydiaceae bacterium]|nr:dual specificity protein phosphatase family protein [Parachlamydiaceae bacterium]